MGRRGSGCAGASDRRAATSTHLRLRKAELYARCVSGGEQAETCGVNRRWRLCRSLAVVAKRRSDTRVGTRFGWDSRDEQASRWRRAVARGSTNLHLLEIVIHWGFPIAIL